MPSIRQRAFRFVFLIFLFPAAFAQQPTAPLALQECQIRNGLPNFFRKIRQQKPVKIAYIGGSITEAKDGWREQTLGWFQQTYPQTSISSINAGVSGTGSDLGVFRLQQHVLVHNPDLVFVEFAVNDASRKADDIQRSMEGIVRQIWRHNPATDICFVYTLTTTMASTYRAGNVPISVAAMEQVADHYAIPSIQMGLPVLKMAETGQLVFKGKPADFPDKLVFSGDDVHPYPQTGHRLYAEAVARSIRQLEPHKGRKHRLAKPLKADNLEKARMLSIRELRRSAGWQELTPDNDTVAQQLRNRFTYLLKSNQPGQTLSFTFKGTQFGLYDVMGPGCGQYRIVIDGQPARLQPRFDEYCTYYRSNYFLAPALPNGVHTVELTVADEPLDKAAILSKRNNTINDPRRYADRACYAAQLMLVGELMP